MFKQAKIKDIAELAIVKLHGKEATKPVSLFIVQGVQKSHKTYGVRPHRLSAFATAPDGDGPSTPSLPPLTVGPSAGSGGRLSTPIKIAMPSETQHDPSRSRT